MIFSAAPAISQLTGMFRDLPKPIRKNQIGRQARPIARHTVSS